jgi:hypothetical protein
VQTDDYAHGLCEYHLERKGVAVPATRIVNDEPMCPRCFAGAAIFPFEKIGDSEGSEEARESKRNYLARNQHARERKRLRDALWRDRQREKFRLNAAPTTQDPHENAPAAAAYAALGD